MVGEHDASAGSSEGPSCRWCPGQLKTIMRRRETNRPQQSADRRVRLNSLSVEEEKQLDTGRRFTEADAQISLPFIINGSCAPLMTGVRFLLSVKET